MSPRDESPDKMTDLVNQLRGDFQGGVTIALDPQFYASTIPQANDRHLPKYPYYQSSLTRSQLISARNIATYVQSTLDYECQLDLDCLISPSPLFDSFADPWSQTALTMAQESVNCRQGLSDSRPLFISLPFSETALDHFNAMEEFLDIISVMPADGFYVLVKSQSESFPPRIEASRLKNLMYFIYVLSELNGFHVLCGYTDLVGLLLQAVGAQDIATGWSHGLRMFSMRRFIPSSGGRQPRPRYTSSPLLNSILVSPELETIRDLGYIDRVLSGTQYDDQFILRNPGEAPWTPEVSCLHHWSVLQSLTSRIEATQDISDRLDLIGTMVSEALGTYTFLQRDDVPFSPSSGPANLELWRQGLEDFRNEVSI